MPSKKKEEVLAVATVESVLTAAKCCGDASVLEALYPKIFKSKEGKKALEKSKRAVKKIKEKTTPKVKKNTEGVVITLNRKEAEVLRCITGSVVGDVGGPRGVTDKVYHALSQPRGKRPSFWFRYSCSPFS